MARIAGKGEPDESRRRIWLLSLLLIASTAVAYFPAWFGKPIWDDNAHMTQPALRSWHGLVQIWTQLGATQQYYPLVHTVFWIQHALWGDSALPYHLLNILLHALSAIVLYRILRELEIRGAWLAAALFALHPVQVESVAWISELKNTLSGLFFLAATFTYLRFDRTRSSSQYVTAFVLFLAGLLCKTVIAPLPAVLLVVFWWKRGNFSLKREAAPLIPFFIVGISAGLFTAWVEHNFVGAHGSAFHLSLLDRCLIAGRDFWFYLFKLVWPQDLTFIYPRWRIDSGLWWQWLFPTAALLIFVLLWKLRKQMRGPLAAMLIFVGLLFPALGFVNVYPFIYSFVADHFQYLACIAPLTLLAAGIAEGLDQLEIGRKFGRRLAYALPVLVLGVLTWQQSRQYTDIGTLWRTTIARNPDCWMAYSNLGSLLLARGDLDQAIRDFRKALELWPDQSKDHNNLGNALAQKGRMAEAMEQFQTALKLSPDNPDTETNIGAALLQQGETDEAISHLKRAIEKSPDNAQAHINLGNAFLQKRDADSAIAEYRKTVELPFDHAESFYSIANAYRQKGDVEQAIVEYRKAIELRPDYANAHNNLGNALRQQGKLDDAVREYESALQYQPGFVLAENNLAWILATAADPNLRNGARAVQLAEQAVVATDGNDPFLLHTLAAAYAETGEFEKAVGAAEDALKIAEANGIKQLVESLRTKIILYQSGTAYHESEPADR